MIVWIPTIALAIWIGVLFFLLKRQRQLLEELVSLSKSFGAQPRFNVGELVCWDKDGEERTGWFVHSSDDMAAVATPNDTGASLHFVPEWLLRRWVG